MLFRMKILNGFVFILSLAKAIESRLNDAQAIIIDTDLMSDVDDVGAITVANVLHDRESADIRGIAINTHSKYGALAANVQIFYIYELPRSQLTNLEALCNYFNNGDIPIAAIRPLTNATFLDTYTYTLGEYASKLAYNWPRTLERASSTMTPVELYRSVLTKADENSLHIISIGFLTNLADLLRSEADNISTLVGIELVCSKVSELIIMGGMYPSGWEFNFGGEDPASTIYVLKHWPSSVPITLSGGELGGNIYSDQKLAQHSPPDSPVLASYQWYVGRCSTIRESWDPLTTLYGILGLDGFSKIGIKPPLAYANEFGYNSVTSSNASNAWVNDTNVTNQHWLRLADGVSNSSVAWLLDQFFMHDPVDKSCVGHGATSCILQTPLT